MNVNLGVKVNIYVEFCKTKIKHDALTICERSMHEILSYMDRRGKIKKIRC